MKVKKEIGSRITSALALRGKKQKELARAIDVTDNTISYYCSGSRTPNLEQLIKISDFLNVTTDYLLGRTNDPNVIPVASDELSLSPQVVQWIKEIQSDPRFFNGSNQKLSELFGNEWFQKMCIASIEYKHAVQAELIERIITGYCERKDPQCTDSDLFMNTLMLVANSDKLSERTRWFIKSKCSLYNADDSIFNALYDDIDDFSFVSLWYQRTTTYLIKLLDDIKASVTNDIVEHIDKNIRNANDKDALDDAILESLL